MDTNNFSFKLDGQPCGRCGYPLPNATIWRIITDECKASVIKAVFNGSINNVRCQHCNAEGRILSPFLWVDKKKKRAVFVTVKRIRMQSVESECEKLLTVALDGVDIETQKIICKRIQVEEAPNLLPAALAASNLEAEVECAGRVSLVLRQGLPFQNRLNMIVKDAISQGSVVLGGVEKSEAFYEFVKQEIQLSISANEEPKKNVLKQLKQMLEMTLNGLEKANSKSAVSNQPDFEVLWPKSYEVGKSSSSSALLDWNEEESIDMLIDSFLLESSWDSLLELIQRTKFSEKRLVNRLEVLIEEAFQSQTMERSDKLQRIRHAIQKCSQRNRNSLFERNDKPENDIEQFLEVILGANSDESDKSWAYLGLVDYYKSVGHYDNAVEAAERSLSIATRLREDQSAITMAYAAAGINLAICRKESDALEYLQEALRQFWKISDKDGGLTPSFSIIYAETLDYLGCLLFGNGSFAKAKSVFEDAIIFCEQAGLTERLRSVLRSAGNLYLRMGDHLAAINSSEKLLGLCSEQDSTAAMAHIFIAGPLSALLGPPEYILNLVVQPCSVEDEQNDGDTSQSGLHHETNWREDSDVMLPSNTENEVDEDLENVLVSGRFIVRTYWNEEYGQSKLLMEGLKRDAAVDHLIQARAIALDLNDIELQYRVLTKLVEVYSSYGMSVAVQDARTQLYQLTMNSKLPMSYGSLLDIGSSWERTAIDNWQQNKSVEAQDAWETALSFANSAIELIQSNKASSKDVHALLNGAVLRAICLEALGRHREAYEAYQAAQGIFEGIRQSVSENRYKKTLQEGFSLIHPRTVRSTLKLFEEEPSREMLLKESFKYSEAGRSRILLDIIDKSELKSAEQDFFGHVARPATIQEITAELPQGTAIIQYSLVPNYCHCRGYWAIFCILPGIGIIDKVVKRDLEEVSTARDVFYKLIDAFESDLGVRLEVDRNPMDYLLDVSQKHREAFTDALESLGELLLPSCILRVLLNERIKRLVFIPEGYLFDIPFSALRIYDKGVSHYLIGNDVESHFGFEFTTSPSISAYLSLIRSGSDSRRMNLRSLCVSNPTCDLTWSSDWIDRIAESYWNTTEIVHLYGRNATSDSVVEKADSCNLFLYVGHGDYIAGDSMSSGMILHDGTLTVRRLLSSECEQAFNQCQHVILLACSGSKIDSSSQWEAREIIGLSSALHQRGVSAVVGGLWALRGGFATQFGESLIQSLEHGLPIGASVRMALTEIISSGGIWSHPYFWGAIHLTGNESSRFSNN